MKMLCAAMLAIAALLPTQAARTTQTVIGIITDDECAKGDHSRMKMGPTDAECTIACIDFHGASYVLYDGKDTYKLSDQKAPEKYAGQKVRVTGTVDAGAKAIAVQTIESAR